MSFRPVARMCSLSYYGSHGRALGPWYVYSNYEPLYSGATNWGARVKSAAIGISISVVEGRRD